ncbi:uncharacterized protein B0H18DRAFT_971069 [Fomitopsis serialis]|uniref:uncharacterized protein n=1 Tax=Fomitopsis serialis TaxID=139415 RepID=UPI00200782D5|nr:uncharacterized protein B0H18DRAFT_971069 [Neoantrodia serialis]KAH9937530.1 hypothetical protein B0H18DRAFT_971069 [Neoantrodia serialis]
MHAGPRLVDDLIPHILNAYDHWWPRDFTRLALVSPAWLEHVRKHLYLRPTLYTSTACVSFARSIGGNPHLAFLVRGIELRPAVDRPIGRGCSAELMASLRRILSLGGLQKVALGGSLAVAAERFLQFLISPQTVTELCVDGSYTQAEPWARTCSLEWDDMMACRFVRLQSLILSNLELTVLSWSTSCGRLTSLTVDNVAVVSGSMIDLVHDSLDTLRSLQVCIRDVSNSRTTDQLVCILMARCPRLETLSYEHRSSHLDHVFWREAPPRNPAIHKLRLSGLYMGGPMLVHIAESCRNLQVLEVVGRDVCVVPASWTDLVTSDILSALRQLLISPPMSFPPNPETKDLYRPLFTACGERNIVLSFQPCSF